MFSYKDLVPLRTKSLRILPPRMLAGNTSDHNCHSCNEHDVMDSMVACDNCGDWHHFKCVGVDNTVKDRNWICKKCEQGAFSGLLNLPQAKDKPIKSGGSKSSKPRSRKAEKRLDLK